MLLTTIIPKKLFGGGTNIQRSVGVSSRAWSMVREMNIKNGGSSLANFGFTTFFKFF
jgi:hypothetical protein